MLKNGKFEVQPNLIQVGALTEAELTTMEKFLKEKIGADYKGDKERELGDIYDLARACYLIKDAEESDESDDFDYEAVGIVRRLAETYQFVEV